MAVRLIPGQAWNLFQVSAEGGSPEQLTRTPSADLDPSYSPDGQTVAFGRGQRSIQLLDIPTRQLRTLPGSAENLLPPVVTRRTLHRCPRGGWHQTDAF